jgi:hypothetical protein
VVAGALAQRPGIGGHTWQFLQYLLGFKRLGWDVLFLDRLEPEMCVDTSGRPSSVDESWNLQYFLTVMERFGLGRCFSLGYHQGERVFGLSRTAVLERTRHSALLLNVMGYLTDEEILGQAPLRVFLDTDPGFGQMWQDLGQTDLFRGHDRYVTIGENIGRIGCTIPTCGLEWVTTRQPVVLDEWPAHPNSRGGIFTSIATWRGLYASVEHRGTTYGLRAHEFRKFAPLPRLSGQPFELALDIEPADARDRALLETNGWSLVDPKLVAGDPWRYREYIQRSSAELMIAKGIYVQSNSGWFSDRSICYLASGKPVVALDTGLRDLYPTGQGLLVYSTLDEALAAAHEVAANYSPHARAARELAVEYFDSDKVWTNLLRKLGLA